MADSKPDPRQLVRQIAREYLETEAPEQLEELEVVFDSVYRELTEGGTQDQGDADHPREMGFPIDAAFLDGTLVSSVLWITVTLVREALERRRQPDVSERLSRLETLLAKSTGEEEHTRDLLGRVLDRVVRGSGDDGTVSREAPPAEAGSGHEVGLSGPAADLQLFVSRGQRDGKVLFAYTLHSDALGLFHQDFGFIELELGFDPFAYFKEFLHEIEELPTGTQAEQEKAERRLRNRGAKLFKSLLPELLREKLWELWDSRRVRTLQIVSGEPWIPWELLCFQGRRGDAKASGPFWGEAFVLTRWLPGATPVSTLPLSKMALVVAGDAGLPQAEAEKGFLLSLEGEDRSVREVPARFSEVIDALASGEYDGWHFICHAEARGTDADCWALRLGGYDDLTPDDLQGEAAGLGKAKPLFFLNACQTGQSGLSLTDVGGWAAGLLEAGAGAFVGPLWSIRDSRAIVFAQVFYQGLLAGETLGEAAHKARQELREKFPGDPSGLGYVVYGMPGARVRPTFAEACKSFNTATAPSSFDDSTQPYLWRDEASVDKQPPKTWKGKRGYARIARELTNLPATEFRDRVRNLLHLLVVNSKGIYELSTSAYRDGHLTWGAGPSYSMVVSCQLFDTPAADLGKSEVEQVVRAARAFQAGSCHSEKYLVIHNRDSRNENFREAVGEALAFLRQDGCAEQVEMWDYRIFLHKCFDAMFHIFTRMNQERNLSPLRAEDLLGGFRDAPVELVPYILSTLVVNQHELQSKSNPHRDVGDISEIVVRGGVRDQTIILGEFGFGKTTAVGRILQDSGQVYMVPGAIIDRNISGSKLFLEKCVDIDVVLEGFPKEARRDYRLILRSVIEFFFGDPESHALLILDGLDESAFLARVGGLQNLFNNLWEVRVPVVLTMRTEFWRRHEGAFAMPFGEEASHSERRFRQIQCVELLPWEEPQIQEFLRRYRDSRKNEEARERIRQLEGWLRTGLFDKFYGDIPKRPLFLRFIADAVVEDGLPRERRGRAGVFRDGAQYKIRRDIYEPRRTGGRGRAPILDKIGPPEKVVALAWEIMLQAANAMTLQEGVEIELLPDCRWDEVRKAIPKLEQVEDPGAVFLHSLLLPTAVRQGQQPNRVRFAHRAYQEFFLAWYLIENRKVETSSSLPGSVLEWIQDLRVEGLVDELGKPSPVASRIQERRSRVQADFKLTVRLVERSADWKILYEISAADASLGLNETSYGPVSLGKEPQRYVDDLFRDIEDLSAESEEDQKVTLDSLEAIGGQLGRRLLPSDLQEQLWRLSERGGSLLIQSDEPWVPWELVKLQRRIRCGQSENGPFLCEMFAVTRWLRGVGFTEVFPLSRLGLITPRDKHLSEVQKEREDLLALRRPGERDVVAIKPQHSDVIDALAAGTYDGLHFAGHADAARDNADKAMVQLEGSRRLRPRDLHGRAAGLSRGHPLVFLNACRSGRGGHALAGLGGWAKGFLEVGAGAFLGTFWEVPDKKARIFATTFYHHFLAGVPIGEAVRRTRLEIRKRYQGHPVWLAYTVFAHPGAVCSSAVLPDSQKVRPRGGDDSREVQGSEPGGERGPVSVTPPDPPFRSPAEPEPGTERLHEKDGTVLVYVPGGIYTLGADDLQEEAKPVHRVRLSPFWIGKYPVTNEQYARFLKEDPDQREPQFWNDETFNQPQQPVVGVSWAEAEAYCRWAGLRLPSEAQWEASARGHEGRRYPWGDSRPTPELANFGGKARGPTPVASHPPGAGPFGTFDQAGNVWEWCADSWSLTAYKERADGEPDPLMPGDASFCVVRGGSWLNPAQDLHAACREGATASLRLKNQGFRCVLSMPD